jgi:predicted DNA-binding transcriptional regulator AlpA
VTEDSVTGPSLLSPICADAKDLATLLKVSVRTLHRLDDRGRIPAAIELGGCKRWVIAEIEAWLRAGAPPRQQWNLIRRREP